MTRRKFRLTTDSGHGRPMAEKILDRRFEPESADRAWAVDVTYIPTREGWLYLAAVEDLHSRRIAVWSTSGRKFGRLVVDAQEMAVSRRLPGEGLVAHSDRGSTYASENYRRILVSRVRNSSPNLRDRRSPRKLFSKEPDDEQRRSSDAGPHLDR